MTTTHCTNDDAVFVPQHLVAAALADLHAALRARVDGNASASALTMERVLARLEVLARSEDADLITVAPCEYPGRDFTRTGDTLAWECEACGETHETDAA